MGVQDEDSLGKSNLCETCPAIGLRSKCHKASERSPSAFLHPQACRGGSRATRGKRSLARKSLAVLRLPIVRLYIVVF
ncbi:hypothetical protein FZC88_19480 [Rossellomorea aquimaris]|nr:hypothetical protein FZC88_19480 [Rossellomorea aquimaris]